jgi:hypothetical protein
MTTTSGSDVTISYDASLAPSGLAGSSVTLGNTTSQDVSATCVVAYYSNGRLLNCEVQTVQISANGTATVVINGNSSAVTAKILVMNGSDSVPNTCVVYGA